MRRSISSEADATKQGRFHGAYLIANIPRIGITLVGLSMLAGCDADSDSISQLSSVVGRVQQVNESLAAAGGTANDVATTGISFAAPYPNRTDPFHFPGDESDAAETPVSLISVGDIVILGFASVNEKPKVFLRSKDVTRVLAVGDRVDNVEVQAIDPPRVELRMGTLVWTATMFDHSR